MAAGSRGSCSHQQQRHQQQPHLAEAGIEQRRAQPLRRKRQPARGFGAAAPLQSSEGSDSSSLQARRRGFREACPRPTLGSVEVSVRCYSRLFVYYPRNRQSAWAGRKPEPVVQFARSKLSLRFHFIQRSCDHPLARPNRSSAPQRPEFSLKARDLE